MLRNPLRRCVVHFLQALQQELAVVAALHSHHQRRAPAPPSGVHFAEEQGECGVVSRGVAVVEIQNQATRTQLCCFSWILFLLPPQEAEEAWERPPHNQRAVFAGRVKRGHVVKLHSKRIHRE